MHKHSSMMANPFMAKCQQNTKLQLSTRLLQYINMYSLKHDQIVYQCPILKTQPISQDQQEFHMELQCLQEMNDIQIVYKAERSKELERVRMEQKKLDEEQQKKREAERKKNQGFFGKMFGSSQKNKGQSKSTGKKLKIDQNMIKSSVHVTKINAQLQASKLSIKNSALAATRPSEQVLPNSVNSQPQPDPFQIKDKDKDKVNIQPEMPPANGNPFAEQMQQGNLDDLESVQSSNKLADMSKIKQEEEEERGSQSRRESKASRVHLDDLQNDPNYKIPRDRMSKRSRNRDRDSDDQDPLRSSNGNNKQQVPNMSKKQQVAQQKIEQTKPKPKIKPKIDPKAKTKDETSSGTLDKDNQSNIKRKSKSKDKNQDKNKKNKTKGRSISPHKNNKGPQKIDYVSKRTPNQSPTLKKQPKSQSKSNEHSDVVSLLDSYINSEISRLTQSLKPVDNVSEIIHKNSEINSSVQYSMLSSADILGNQEPKPKQDSFSDVKIDWIVKLELCELQENLLIKRLTSRWNRQFDSVARLRALRIGTITKQIQADPKLTWVRPNFSFGTIVQ